MEFDRGSIDLQQKIDEIDSTRHFQDEKQVFEWGRCHSFIDHIINTIPSFVEVSSADVPRVVKKFLKKFKVKPSEDAEAPEGMLDCDVDTEDAKVVELSNFLGTLSSQDVCLLYEFLMTFDHIAYKRVVVEGKNEADENLLGVEYTYADFVKLCKDKLKKDYFMIDLSYEESVKQFGVPIPRILVSNKIADMMLLTRGVTLHFAVVQYFDEFSCWYPRPFEVYAPDDQGGSLQSFLKESGSIPEKGDPLQLILKVMGYMKTSLAGKPLFVK